MCAFSHFRVHFEKTCTRFCVFGYIFFGKKSGCNVATQNFSCAYEKLSYICSAKQIEIFYHRRGDGNSPNSQRAFFMPDSNKT